MDRRAFLQSGSLAAAAGGQSQTSSHLPQPRRPAPGPPTRDWSNRRPQGEPVVKRFDEQRWVLDNVIQANGIDWDQGHTGAPFAASDRRRAGHG